MKTDRSNRGIRNTDSTPAPRATSRGLSAAPQYVRLETLLSMVPMSPSTVWRKVRDGSFVKPVRLSANITAWNLELVKRWIAEREAS